MSGRMAMQIGEWYCLDVTALVVQGLVDMVFFHSVVFVYHAVLYGNRTTNTAMYSN